MARVLPPLLQALCSARDRQAHAAPHNAAASQYSSALSMPHLSTSARFLSCACW